MRAPAVLAAALLLAWPAAAAPKRTMAITIDDLPYASAGVPCEPGADRAFTAEFLRMLKGEGVPAVGFAITGQTCGDAPPAPVLIEAWLDAGFEIGSHSATHPNLNDVGMEAYEADVLAAETVLKPMLERRGQTLVWYRHPYLRTGATPEISGRLSAFLAGRGYRVAPVTLDNSEWVFAVAYAKALYRNDADEARRVGEAYVDYMDEIAAFFESRALAIVGRETPQVLLIHANQLNRDWFPALKRRYEARGYGFVSLAKALEDPAYALPDTYAGRWGMSWILRWGASSGVKVVREPDAPAWITRLYDAPLGCAVPATLEPAPGGAKLDC